MAAENERALRRLAEAGKRLTPERELLLRIINQNAHLDASEIYEIARRERPRIGLATVYRTLNTLRELGLVRSTELGESHRHFEVEHDDHVHLICSQCGRVFEVPAPKELDQLAASQGFLVRQSHVDLVGLCEDCQAESSESEEDTKS